MMNETYHYPPDLMSLLIDAIPLLNRSKRDMLLFFRGSGVPIEVYRDLEKKVEADRNSVKKIEIARQILMRLNDGGDRYLRQRREIIRRVVQFEDFSSCWDDDRLKAQGLVANIQKLVNVKDSFTRMKQEREKERKARQAEQKAKIERVEVRRRELKEIKDELFAQFNETNHQKRGKALESILNRLFAANDILVREAFVRVGTEREGIVEQIDGVIELDGQLYLVEMKWHSDKLGKEDVSQHMVRLFRRTGARGIMISASGFTDPAVALVRESLGQIIVLLIDLEELVVMLEKQADLINLLKSKVNAAILDGDPYRRLLTWTG